MEDNHLTLDEEHNGLDFLIQSLVFLSQVEQNPYYLKWFIISFHGALYEFMLLVISGKNQQYVYEKKSKSHQKRNGEMQDQFYERLIPFIKAYEYIKLDEMVKGSPFVSSGKIDDSINELNNKLRNQMMHFKPMIWVSEPWYPALVCLPLIDLLKYCIKNEGIQLVESERRLSITYLSCIKSLLLKHSNQ